MKQNKNGGRTMPHISKLNDEQENKKEESKNETFLVC